jgi:hypothetical protein
LQQAISDNPKITFIAAVQPGRSHSRTAA